MMADDDQLCALALAAAVVTVVAARDIVRKRKRKRLLWTRPLFQKRSQYGAYNLLMAELRASDCGRFRGFTRFTVEEFDELLSLVKDDITGSAAVQHDIGSPYHRT